MYFTRILQEQKTGDEEITIFKGTQLTNTINSSIKDFYTPVLTP